MIKHSLTKFSALAIATLAVPALTWAATDKEVIQPKGKNVVEQTSEPCITGDLGVNVVSQYISRGVIFENQGGIIEPYADLYLQVYKGDGILTKAQINVGVWDSLHSRHTDHGPSATAPNWYESDFTTGVTLTFMKNIAVTPSYFAFMSPNGAFSTFQGLNLKVAYDDTDLLHAFALHPYFQILWELDHKVGIGPSQGVYYEVGIAPAIPTGPLKDLTLTLPITVGLGSHNFYGELQKDGTVRDNAFGYFSVGVNASYALSFIPKCYGAWTLNGGVTYYYLHDNLSRADSAVVGGDIRAPKHNEWLFSGGVALAF